MIGLATREPDTFAAIVGKAPTILKDGKLITEQTAANEGDLTPAQLALCTATGVTPEAFKAQRAAEAKQKGTA